MMASCLARPLIFVYMECSDSIRRGLAAATNQQTTTDYGTVTDSL
jgi:hypothetical protein